MERRLVAKILMFALVLVGPQSYAPPPNEPTIVEVPPAEVAAETKVTGQTGTTAETEVTAADLERLRAAVSQITPQQKARTLQDWQALADRAKAGLNTFRVMLFADDKEIEGVKALIEEGEHAVEPPMEEEGFWRRKWEILKSLGSLFKGEIPPALDFRRSYQNVMRLMHISKNFEDPWVRNMILNSATMFGLTHGSEFLSGVVMGTKALLSGDIAQAMAWYGLALPGFYDFGCWIGQGILLTKPGREGFGWARNTVMMLAGKAADKVGLNVALEALFEHEPVREALKRAVENGKANGFEIVISDAELMKLVIRNKEGKQIAELQMENGKDGELILRSLKVDRKAFVETDFGKLSNALNDLGWNVVGAMRQVHYLMRSKKEQLIAHEKTFVSSVDAPEGASELTVHFREDAVHLYPQRVVRQNVKDWVGKTTRSAAMGLAALVPNAEAALPPVDPNICRNVPRAVTTSGP